MLHFMVVTRVFAGRPPHEPPYILFQTLRDPFLNLSGWTVVLSGMGATGTITFPDAVEKPPGCWILPASMFPALFQMAQRGVLYLYSSSGARMYQMGWSSLDMTGETATGYPPGHFGHPHCFDSVTCGLISLDPHLDLGICQELQF